jgi:hypothetical protein
VPAHHLGKLPGIELGGVEADEQAAGDRVGPHVTDSGIRGETLG